MTVIGDAVVVVVDLVSGGFFVSAGVVVVD